MTAGSCFFQVSKAMTFIKVHVLGVDFRNDK
jgi:hypothetical protein